jgi:hypothetical protein
MVIVDHQHSDRKELYHRQSSRTGFNRERGSGSWTLPWKAPARALVSLSAGRKRTNGEPGVLAGQQTCRIAAQSWCGRHDGHNLAYDWRFYGSASIGGRHSNGESAFRLLGCRRRFEPAA